KAAERRLRTEWKLDGAARALVDLEAARQVLTNLFDNVVAHAETGGQACTSIVDEEGRVAVTVANTGCTLDKGDATRVFDRFWRGDSSRSGAGQHCGLGLSLCRKLVELHGGSISADIHDGLFSVTFVLPVAPQTHPRVHTTGTALRHEGLIATR